MALCTIVRRQHCPGRGDSGVDHWITIHDTKASIIKIEKNSINIVE